MTKVQGDKKKSLEKRFRDHGFRDFKWIDPKKIIVSHWVRMKCLFGCPEYGKSCCCPPGVPPVRECEQFFLEYGSAVVFHFKTKVEKPEDRHQWTREVNQRLSGLEREVFVSGFEKTFLLFMDTCGFCRECVTEKEKCHRPHEARPAPEALAVDVYATVRQYGFPIKVLSDYTQEMNRYAFLMID